MAMNFETARQNMIAQEIRTWDVLNERVLAAIEYSPREDYVPEQYRALAFADMNIPLGHRQVMMTPKLEARLIQALELTPRDRVLEIGTGSGYVTSLLAMLGGHVHSIEIVPEFSEQAHRKLAAHGVTNLTLEVGDGARGWNRHAPYDAIFVTGSLPLLPVSFQDSLAVGGRLIAIVGQAPVMQAQLIRRTSADRIRVESLLETSLPPLVNAEQPPAFVF